MKRYPVFLSRIICIAEAEATAELYRQWHHISAENQAEVAFLSAIRGSRSTGDWEAGRVDDGGWQDGHRRG